MTPYTATDVLRSMRHAHGIPENPEPEVRVRSQGRRWLAVFRRS